MMSQDPKAEAATAHAPIRLPGLAWRRYGLLALVIASTGFAVERMLGVVQADGFSTLDAITLVLFAATFAWITVAFWTALAGFVLGALDRDPLSLGRRATAAADDGNRPTGLRTALVMPICHEHVARVSAGLEATWRDLCDNHTREAFDAFILSDSVDPETVAAEEAAVTALRRRLPAGRRIFYRRRRQPTGRKAGNIADFCRRWGGRYDALVVLDADSIMSGHTLLTLVRTLAANPRAGMLQTVPLPIQARTRFARCLQFAAHLYSPMLATGMSFWQGDTANYWGHNAIIRMSAFADHCGLPRLHGRGPLAGDILSHDFVEAALMRRAGWHVYLLPDLGGSYETLPATLLDYAGRDRRWAEGNLQHLRLLGARGLHPLSRLYFVMGAMAYGCSLLWLLILGVTTLGAGLNAMGNSNTERLHPQWSTDTTSTMLLLMAAVVSMLILPKLLALGLCLADRERRKAFGGGVRASIDTLKEFLFSVLIAPVLMTFHAGFVIRILCGQRVRWEPQDRAGHTVAWSRALRTAGAISSVGFLWAAGAWIVAPTLFWALTPVLAGLLLAPALIVLSSRTASAQHLQTPADTRPPAVLRCLQQQPSSIPLGASAPPAPAPAERAMPIQRLDQAGSTLPPVQEQPATS